MRLLSVSLWFDISTESYIHLRCVNQQRNVFRGINTKKLTNAYKKFIAAKIRITLHLIVCQRKKSNFCCHIFINISTNSLIIHLHFISQFIMLVGSIVYFVFLCHVLLPLLYERHIIFNLSCSAFVCVCAVWRMVTVVVCWIPILQFYCFSLHSMNCSMKIIYGIVIDAK